MIFHVDQFHLVVVNSVSLSKEKQSEIISFCNRAFGEDLKPFFGPYNQATHILEYHSQTLVSHAMWLTRWLQVGTNKVMRTIYVEMVATEKSHRARGYGTAVMERVAEEIQDFDLGALSPFSVAFYERPGWELWRGPLFIRTDGGGGKDAQGWGCDDSLPSKNASVGSVCSAVSRMASRGALVGSILDFISESFNHICIVIV
jgi:aminoglycoside 2'-N-acetyltransferase I